MHLYALELAIYELDLAVGSLSLPDASARQAPPLAAARGPQCRSEAAEWLPLHLRCVVLDNVMLLPLSVPVRPHCVSATLPVRGAWTVLAPAEPAAAAAAVLHVALAAGGRQSAKKGALGVADPLQLPATQPHPVLLYSRTGQCLARAWLACTIQDLGRHQQPAGGHRQIFNQWFPGADSLPNAAAFVRPVASTADELGSYRWTARHVAQSETKQSRATLAEKSAQPVSSAEDARPASDGIQRASRAKDSWQKACAATEAEVQTRRARRQQQLLQHQQRTAMALARQRERWTPSLTCASSPAIKVSLVKVWAHVRKKR